MLNTNNFILSIPAQYYLLLLFLYHEYNMYNPLEISYVIRSVTAQESGWRGGVQAYKQMQALLISYG